jgi:predicted HTH domain antitoxin
MNLTIPDDILTASEMSEAELKLEIAIVLYKREKISTGKASEWLGMNLIEFRRELGKRGITINYDVEDFQADVETLRSLGRL